MFFFNTIWAIKIWKNWVGAWAPAESALLRPCFQPPSFKFSVSYSNFSSFVLLQSFYYDGKAVMSNEEFDNLKEELMWEGSSVVMLSNLVSTLGIFFFYIILSVIYIYVYILWLQLFIYNAGSDEQKFLEASMAYVSGKPIMTDEEYDKLKMQLKVCQHVLILLLFATAWVLDFHSEIWIYQLKTFGIYFIGLGGYWTISP